MVFSDSLLKSANTLVWFAKRKMMTTQIKTRRIKRSTRVLVFERASSEVI